VVAGGQREGRAAANGSASDPRGGSPGVRLVAGLFSRCQAGVFPPGAAGDWASRSRGGFCRLRGGAGSLRWAGARAPGRIDGGRAGDGVFCASNVAKAPAHHAACRDRAIPNGMTKKAAA